MKQKRIVNKKLIEEVKRKNCQACYMEPPVDAHHVKSKKTGGHDIEQNLMPLCRRCHTTVHTKGLTFMSSINEPVEKWLERNGWEKQDGKWRRWK